MTSSVRILSTSSVDSLSPSLLLVNPDGTKYMVNCGEGSQRLMLEHQQRLSTVTAVCIPVLRHAAVMGLPGWILTATDVLALKQPQKSSPSSPATAMTMTTTTSTATATARASARSGTDTNEQRQREQQQRHRPETEDKIGGEGRDGGGGGGGIDHPHEPTMQLLHLFGPRGTQEFVNSLRHFIKPRGGHGNGHGSGPGGASNRDTGDEEGVNGAARRRQQQQQQQQHGQSPFGNVRVWEGENGRSEDPGADLVDHHGHGSCVNSSSSNCGFDRFAIRCYAFDDNDEADVGGNDNDLHEAEQVEVGAAAAAASTAEACSSTPGAAGSHNKRPYSQVRGEDADDGANEEPVHSPVHPPQPQHEAYPPRPPTRQRQQRQKQQELCFLFTSPPLPGKFLPHEAARLGVPKGPLFGTLKAGQPVTFDAAATPAKKKKYSKNSSGNPKMDDVPAAPRMVTVHPWQVVAPDSPGVAVLVLHYDTCERLAEILRSADFLALAAPSSFAGTSSNPWQLEVVVHMTPESAWMDEAVDAFSTQPEVEHVWLSTEPLARRGHDEDKATAGDYGTPFRAAALGACIRHTICESVYQSPTLPSALLQNASSFTEATTRGTPPTESTASDAAAHASSGRRYVAGQTMMEYVLMPRTKRGWTQAMTPSPAAHEAPALASSSRWLRVQALECARGVIDSDAIRAARLPSLSSTTSTPDESEDRGELFFTGTGSAIPCKHRNVTGICVTASNGNRMLLDAGEGTVGQLLRRVVVQTAPSAGVLLKEDSCEGASLQAATMAEYLTSIRAVWISHSHADHHLGLLRLLQDRQPRDEDDPVLLIAPACIFQFLEKCEAIGLLGGATADAPDGSQRAQSPRYRAVHCWDLVTAPGGNRGASRDGVRRHLSSVFGWTDVQAVPVDHCPNAFAIVLDGTPFGRLVYSGDCRPSRGLARLASPTDVLIHEATFEDGMEDDAKMKKHSTVGEALNVANEMNASCVVLTHFSQRYPRIPPLSPSSPDSEPCSSIPVSRKPTTVVFAFDYMRLTPKNLVEASQFTDALRLLYCCDSTSATNEEC